jgi:hypothetical protein
LPRSDVANERVAETARILASARLPDVSCAGYRCGEAPPHVPVVADARRFGAAGDGTTDDTLALQAAIDATRDGALVLPAGRYVIHDVLHIPQSRVVIRGEGPERTVLVVAVSLTEAHPLPVGSGNSYSFGGGFVDVRGRVEGRTLDKVVLPAPRGADRLALAEPLHRKPGELVRIRMDTSPGLAREILGGALEPGAQTARDFSHYVDWAVRVASVEGSTLRLAHPLRVDVRPEWAAEVVAFEPTIEEVGIEDLSFEFPGVPKKPHLEEEGFNAIFMKDVAHAWVRNVTVTDADNAVNLWRCRFCQVENVRLRTAHRTSVPSGHHGLWAKETQDCLFSDFRIDTIYEHDLSVEGFANGNVFMRGTGVAINLDHHRNAPYENVFTDLDVGSPERLWRSSGDEARGPHAGVRETLWNVRYLGRPPPLPGAMHSNKPDGGWPELNLLQVAGYPPTSEHESVWVEPAQGAPGNLYEAQRAAMRRAP